MVSPLLPLYVRQQYHIAMSIKHVHVDLVPDLFKALYKDNKCMSDILVKYATKTVGFATL